MEIAPRPLPSPRPSGGEAILTKQLHIHPPRWSHETMKVASCGDSSPWALPAEWPFLPSSSLGPRSLPWTGSSCLEICLRSWTAPWGRGTGRARRRTPWPDIAPPARWTPSSGSLLPANKNPTVTWRVSLLFVCRAQKRNTRNTEWTSAMRVFASWDYGEFDLWSHSLHAAISFPVISFHFEMRHESNIKQN